MEKVSVDTEKRGSSRWIKVLMFMTLVQTIAFVSVTVITVRKYIYYISDAIFSNFCGKYDLYFMQGNISS